MYDKILLWLRPFSPTNEDALTLFVRIMAPYRGPPTMGVGILWVRLERTYTMELTHVKHRLYRIPTLDRILDPNF